MTERKCGGSFVRPDLRLAIYLRDGFKCVYCQKDLHGADPATVTLDHLIPWRMKHGHNGPTNLATSCRSCNSSKGDKLWTVYGSPEAIKRIRVLRRRGLIRRRKMAKTLISDGLKSHHVNNRQYNHAPVITQAIIISYDEDVWDNEGGFIELGRRLV